MANALRLENDVKVAGDNKDTFFNNLNSDASLNLKDGSDYTSSASIGTEITALEKLRDGDTANDRVTSFFNTHDGDDGAHIIDDLADLNDQIADSIVTRNISVTDAIPETVELTAGEVDRLGEGGVQIKATQTDRVGNLHGRYPYGSFVIDTIAPDVDNVDARDDRSPVDIVADVDKEGSFTVTTTFSEKMDRGVNPKITFDPDVESTLTNQDGNWINDTTFVLTADIADAGVDADAVTVGV